MKSITVYRILAIASFLILVSVQFFLVYNTYTLKDEQYFLTEKKILNDQYAKSIRNDKVYPGAQKIIDRYIYGNMASLEDLYNTNIIEFNSLKERVCDSLFTALRAHSNTDSLFQAILNKNKFNHELKYLSTVSAISITFKNNVYIPLYQSDNPNTYLSPGIQTDAGVIIGGHLKDPQTKNLVTTLNVSISQDHTYQIAFRLYVDSPNRYLAILKLMKPTFALCLFSILVVVMIYFFTFRNWLRQKKLAEMRSDFVNSITHEFHTPLATIIVANKNLQNERITQNRENIQPLTQIIDRQSKRLKMLFSRVLEMTTIQKNALNKKQFVLCELLEEILLDYRLMVSENHVEISFEKCDQESKIYLDLFWFTTMLYNIFENALKYNNSTSKAIEIASWEEETVINIQIKDNGVGMSQKTMEHIFEKFYRSKEGNMENVSGLGLGLYYVHQCVKAHDWKLRVQSIEKKGSTFTIIIPKV